MRFAIFAAGALAVMCVALDGASARALPPPSRDCGTLARRVPLRPLRLDATGYPPPTCRVARRVMSRFLRTHVQRIGAWDCDRPPREDRNPTVTIGLCSRNPDKSYRSFISASIRTRARTAADGVESVTSGPTRFRLIRPPLVIVLRDGDQPYFAVRLRFDRALPARGGETSANVLVGTSGSDAPPARYGLRSRHCYGATIGNDVRGGDPALAHVRVGSPVRLTVSIRGQRTVTTATLRAGTHAQLAALGCT